MLHLLLISRKFFQIYDQDRVYPSDIKKVLNWYNMLQAKGLVSKEVPAKAEPAKEEEVETKEA